MVKTMDSEKALDTYLISLHSTKIYQVVKTRDVAMRLSLVCNFVNFLVLILVAAHTVSYLDLGNNKRFEDEGYESG